MIIKIALQSFALDRSKPIKPPNTTRIAISGIIALMPSALPCPPSCVASVSQALKAASFAVEPKKVITQSNTITSDTPALAAAAALKKRVRISIRIKAKAAMEIPHRIYPPQMSSFRLPILSLSAPINKVVNVAATALAATIAEMAAGEAANIL